MKQVVFLLRSRPLLISCAFLISLIVNGCVVAIKNGPKKSDIRDEQKEVQAQSINSNTKKVDVNLPAKVADVPRLECPEKDVECEKDKLGFDALRILHLMIDDDHNGNVDQSESDEFLRDELQYTDGFERHSLFHNNDKLISVHDLWKAWKHSIVYNWTVDDVIEWLVQDVDLPQYSQTFHNFAIDGSVLPRLVNATGPLLASLGIRNPVHKQKLSLKAMDTVLFGAPKKIHSYVKDILLFMAILLVIGISWLALLNHRYSQTQVKKMMKDLESLQKAEDALKKLSKELADAERNHVSMSQEKQEELRLFRHNSVNLKLTRVNNGEKGGNNLSRDGSVYRRQEGERKLKQAEEELATLREALSEAENRLEIQNQLETQWSVPGELQAWLQLTHELEQIHYNAKRQAAERQLMAARDGCDKIKKRNKAFFGSLRMAHSNSLDDIDQSILDARAALEEVKQDLQEKLHRWHTIEMLCGFPVISNPGLNALKQALGRDTGSNSNPRLPGALIAPVSIDEADEDLPPTGYSSATLPSGRSTTFHKHQTTMGSTSSLSHVGKAASTGSNSAGHVRNGSRDNELQGLSAGTTSASGTMGSTSSSVVFHLGDNSPYDRTVSTTSLSPTSTNTQNVQQNTLTQNLPGQARTGYNQSMSYPPYIASSGSSSVISPAMSTTGSSGNLLASHTLPRGAGNSSMKIYNSATGNHLTTKPNCALSSTALSSSTAHNSSDNTDNKSFIGDSGDVINNNISSFNLSNMSSGSHSISHSAAPNSSKMAITQQVQSNNQNNHHEDLDGVSLDSMPRSQSHSALSRASRLARSPEMDYSSIESLQSPRAGGLEEISKKGSKKKKFLSNFLLKGKGKHKTT